MLKYLNLKRDTYRCMSLIKERDNQYYKIALKQVKLKRNLNLDCQSNLHLKTNGALLCEITFNFIQLKSKRTIIMRSNGFFWCKLVWSLSLIILYWDGFNKRKTFILNKIKIKLTSLGLCRIIIFIDEVLNVLNDVW